MHIKQLHDWNVTTLQAIEIQLNLANKIEYSNPVKSARYIAGIDVSVKRDNTAKAVVIVLKLPEFDVVEVSTTTGQIDFPYIPGLLSFREVPITIKAFEKISCIPDIIMIDGQGLAHPRKMGLACHLGLLLNIPTIGCAKSHLCGDYSNPGDHPGDFKYMVDKNQNTIGAVIRTKSAVKPVFVSVGNKIDLASCLYWVMFCCRGYRLPEPTRLAHLASKEKL